MHRFHHKTSGDVPFTEAEELDADNREAAWEAGADIRVAAEVRERRNALLAATDYAGLADYTAKAGELEYRQALRDVPQQNGFPENIVWPQFPF